MKYKCDICDDKGCPDCKGLSGSQCKDLAQAFSDISAYAFQLKPCPFCGSGDIRLTVELKHRAKYKIKSDHTSEPIGHVIGSGIRCFNCYVLTRSFDTNEHAAVAWNTRV